MCNTMKNEKKCPPVGEHFICDNSMQAKGKITAVKMPETVSDRLLTAPVRGLISVAREVPAA